MPKELDGPNLSRTVFQPLEGRPPLNQTVAERRRNMLDRLSEGLNQKMQVDSPPSARSALEEAYRNAREPEALEAPWPQITAYRLAHMLMRDGIATDWHRVEELLTEAAQGGFLGPIPSIYRLIALSKISGLNQPTEQMKSLYGEIQDSLGKLANNGGLLRQYQGDQRPMQSEWINLLELVVYATGLDYEPLAGRSSLAIFSGLGFKSSGWRVIQSKESSEIAYPKALAQTLFQTKVDEQPGPVVAIKVLPDGAGKIECHPTGGAATYGELQRRAMSDLLSLLCGARLSIVDGPKDDDLRQRKSRLGKALKELIPSLTDQAFSAWWENPLPSGPPSHLPQIIILVADSAWSGPGHPTRRGVNRADR